MAEDGRSGLVIPNKIFYETKKSQNSPLMWSFAQLIFIGLKLNPREGAAWGL
jgi:hypothetical protein